MLHPAVRRELLDAELVLVHERFAMRGVVGWHDGDTVFVTADRFGENRILALDARNYDAEPVGVGFVNADGTALGCAEWPPGLCQGEHPILGGRPFICIRGTSDYHHHPSHVDDTWDRYRPRLRLPEVIGHLLDKVPT